jgi:hypothetical protein
VSAPVVSSELHGGRFTVAPEGIIFRGASVTGVDFSGLQIAHLQVEQSSFVECSFSRARLANGNLGLASPPSTYVGCRFDEADLRGVRPGAARFEACRFDGARLDGWLCFVSEFIDCHFAGPLREMLVSGRPFPAARAEDLGRSRNAVHGNDFRAAELKGVEFVRGIDIDAQLMPEGEAYVRVPQAPARIAAARREVEHWPDPTARAHAESMLYFYSIRGYEEQATIFTRRDVPGTVPADVRERVWAMLSSAVQPGG